MKTIIFLSVSILLVACSKPKEEIVDKCLTSSNQTFSDDLESKSVFFENCMKENKYRYICGYDKEYEFREKLSAICYKPQI